MTGKALKIVCLGILVLLLGIPSLAQNTKGDKPTPPTRETRFKTPKKSKTKATRTSRRGEDKAGQRVAPPSKSRRAERAGRPVSPSVVRTRPARTQRAWKGDIAGQRLRPRTETSRAKNVYPQSGNINYSSESMKRSPRDNENPNVDRVRRMQRATSSKPRVGRPIRPVFHKTRPQQSERAWRGDITGRNLRAGRTERRIPPADQVQRPGTSPARSRTQKSAGIPSRISGRAKNVPSYRKFYVNNQSTRLSRGQRAGASANVPPSSASRQAGVKGGKITPRSASAAYLARRSTNTWAHFPRAKRKSERAITTDLAGKKLRGKNYETQRPEVLINPTLRYQKRVAQGERPYEGPAAGGHVSRTRPGRAWSGDITHRTIRGGFRSKKGEVRPGAPLLGRGPGKSALRVGRYQGNIKTGRRIFGDQGETYTGNIRSRRLAGGGGSVTRGWNNKGLPIHVRMPGKGADAGNYSGNIRVGKRGFNNQGEEYRGNIKFPGRRSFSDQGEEYTGNIKAQRFLRGGGSRSGRHWNNNNTPIIVKTPQGKAARIAGYQGNIRGRKIFNDQGEEYTGNIRATRPLKGGGSVSGKLWNNEGQAIARRVYLGQTKITRYSGNIRARRPEKGGGSVSGQLWNNDERPLAGRDYSDQKRLTRYSGNIKAQRPEKGGGSVSGKLWNNDEKPIVVRLPKNREGGDYTGDIKFARNNYKKNPKSADGAMAGKKASSSALKADQYDRGVVRKWDYIKNPSTAQAAQRTREPGRAFGRSADYQGNIRIKKFDLFGKSDLHPDARFVRLNKNNVDEEKDMFTNFKLWWARLFRKSETQPDHLKEKDNDRKPRYDKGEAGLWYE